MNTIKLISANIESTLLVLLIATALGSVGAGFTSSMELASKISPAPATVASK